ncbi:hypothetical protein [Streptomyces goshikiensis]|uniref:hypothetical protein n=1 Tax=Streptomyces goshikiensis TaxID=1942 RepID=UPI002E15D01E|nr:hypothetical protein OG224_06805 [Streptomyces goshikiensis]
MPERMNVSLNTRFDRGAAIEWDIDIVTDADTQIPAGGQLVGCGQSVREVLADLRKKAAHQLALPASKVQIVGYSFYRR